jgi:ABC-2 type transport system ATP-binding protein
MIELRNVVKTFGARRAIDNVSLSVPAGRCYGFLGPNGAGKTTLIRMILGLARPTSGEILVRGRSLADSARDALSGVGGIVEEPIFYTYLSGRRNLELWARVEGNGALGRVDAALARVGLGQRGDDAVKGYSMGMRQRLGVARALLSDPELLVLDEPSNGLDPEGIAEFRQMIRDFVEEGRTVFISSHLLDEIQKICDDVAIVREGQMIVEGAVAEVVEGQGGVRLRVSDPARAGSLLGEQLERAVSVSDGTLVLAGAASDEEVALATRVLVEANIDVFEVGQIQASLEDRFLELMREPDTNSSGARMAGR